MKKNVASQVIGAQMVSATDGSAFTGSVTVYVTGDAGTQAIGSVGSGACAHEGNGYHTYAPAQAETNYDLVAFTFIGTGAVPATVQVFTAFPQTGDTFARVGAPVGASISADVAAVKAQTAAIEVDTADIQTRLPADLVSGRIDASVGAMAANTLTATAIAADAITAAKVAADVTTEIQTGLATAAALATVAGYIDTEITDIQSRLPAALVGGRMDANVGAISADAAAADVLETMLDGTGGHALSLSQLVISNSGSDDCILMTGSGSGNGIGFTRSGAGEVFDANVAAALQQEAADALTAYDPPTHAELTAAVPTANANADALLNRNVSGGSSTGRTVKQAFHFIRNRWVVAAGTLTVYDTDDSTSSWMAAVTGTAGADPVTGVDP